MDTYRLIVIHWSIFTLSIQLIYCASFYSNIDSISFFRESMCNDLTERYIDSEGKESSLILDLTPDLLTHGSCKRILTAPESHGFFIRLTRMNARTMYSSNDNSATSIKNLREINSKNHNSTRSCPLSIYTINDQLIPPWRIDPCQLESNNDQDEPIRLLQGRLRIVWDHGGNTPAYKIVITVVGKGLPCQRKNKYPCLKFGHETLFCISKDLLCDGIRHCPNGSGYDSDEDYEMCSKRKNYDFEKWESFSKEILRNFFESSITTVRSTTKSTLKIEPKPESTNVKEINETETKLNTVRGGITGDLARYGPWGYLMLGMLLCGGALLICGLWECCCRHNKSLNNSTATSANVQGTHSDIENPATPNTPISDPLPPTYEELDPPPLYSVLFPINKVSENDVTGVDINTITNSNNSNNNTHNTNSTEPIQASSR